MGIPRKDLLTKTGKPKRKRGDNPGKHEWLKKMYAMPGLFHTRRLVAGMNQREHFWVRSARAKVERAMGRDVAKWFRADAQMLPVVVKFTRYSERLMDEGDGLPVTCKHLRDGIADAFGCGDSPNDPIRWEYAQEKSPWGTYGFRVVIEQAKE